MTKTTAQIKAEIKSLQARVNMLSYSLFDMGEYNEVWDAIKAFDKSLGDGLQVGRLVQWSACDGYACYFVTKVNKETCTLEHINIGDGYTSPVVCYGKAMRQAVENQVNHSDSMRRMFLSREQLSKGALK